MRWDACLSKKIVPVARFTSGMLCQRVPLLFLRFAAASRTGRARSPEAASSERGGHERSERDIEPQPTTPSHGGFCLKLRYLSYSLAS